MTAPGSNYPEPADDALYLRPLDLTSTTQPILGFRLWSSVGNGADGTTVQRLDPALGWVTIPPLTPVYNGTGADGNAHFAGVDPTALALFDLSTWNGQQLPVRLSFRADRNGLARPGATVDDLQMHEEADDVDGDGLPGVYAELVAYGTDPFLADSDGDGVNDGDEVSGGTDPLDRSSF